METPVWHWVLLFPGGSSTQSATECVQASAEIWELNSANLCPCVERTLPPQDMLQMTSSTMTMAKWLSYCRASGHVWVARARVAVGLAMDHQTVVPSISSAPVELLIEGIFDRHLPWKSAFRQRTAMCALRLRLIFSIMLLRVWCDNNRMCPDSSFFKSDRVSAMHASKQVVQVHASL